MPRAIWNGSAAADAATDAATDADETIMGET